MILPYTPSDEGNVTSKGTRRGEKRWRFSVRDNGIGIDPKCFERVFVVFQRLHSRADHEGPGVGSATCERVVERHGGQVRIESEPGSGTESPLTLPAVVDAQEGA